VLAQKSRHIDLIIGGHTHTFLTQPDIQKNRDGKEVIINQVGWAGINLGRIDYRFSPFIDKGLSASSSVLAVGV
jgi:5'-nucleotidase